MQIVVQMQLQMHFSQHKLKTYCQARDALQHATKNSQKEQGRVAEGRGVASGGRGGRVRIRWQGGRQPALEARDRAKWSASTLSIQLLRLFASACLRLLPPASACPCCHCLRLCLWAVCVICLMPLMKWLLWKWVALINLAHSHAVYHAVYFNAPAATAVGERDK